MVTGQTGGPASPADQPTSASRTVLVAPERLPGWLERFARRHGELVCEAGPDGLRVRAVDGATAELVDRWTGAAQGDPEAFCGEQARPRRLAVLLARKSAHAVGFFDGGERVASKVDRHYVQGRTKAGGWSQQRYARRRSNQADHAYAEAAADAVRVLLPHLSSVEHLVCGGDSGAVAQVLGDTRLAPLAAMRSQHPVLPVPDPRLAVLEEFVALASQVPIRLDELA